jgi:hypothetical protein
MSFASETVLDVLYAAFASSIPATSAVNTFFLSANGTDASNNCLTMQTAMNTYIATNPVAAYANGTATVANSGYRIQIIDADGTVAYDSYRLQSSTASTANTVQNFQNGTINSNQNTRTYNIGAALSNSGRFYQKKYSTTTLQTQMYYAVRQNPCAQIPLGNVVISLNA